MNKNLIKIAVAGLFGLAAISASAEDAYQGSWYALPGVNLMNADNDLDARSRDIGGFLRFGKEVSEHWDVQIGLSHNRVSSDRDEFPSGNYRQSLLGIDALYMFSREKFRPFLLAGIGVAHNKVDYSSASGADYGGSENSGMVNAGLGFQYLFTDNLGLQVDARHVISRAKLGFAGDRDTKTVGNNFLNVGLMFRFGAPAKTAEVEPMPAPYQPALPEAEPAPAAEPLPPMQGPQEPAFEKVTLASEVLFGFDESTLKPEGKNRLDVDVVDKMKAHPEVELVLITGHTDRIGSDGYNQRLSERRANTVKQYLMSQGIAENRLHAVGKGESEPVVDCKGVFGKKAIDCLEPNRRVIVEIEVQRAPGN